MLKEEFGLNLGEDFFPFQIPGITGDGLRMMWEVGAEKFGANIEAIYQIPDNLNWFLLDAVLRQPNLLINQLGDRFMNEGDMGNTTYAGNALHLQPGNYGYCIMDEGILTLRSGSKLFESVRLDVDFQTLMKDLPFAPPVTELLLAPRLMECAEAADSVRRAAEECCGNPELPLIVTLLHAKEFVRSRMLCEEEDSVTRCARSLSDYFCSMLRKRPFKIFCR